MLAVQSLTNIMQSEDNFPVTSCYCTGNPEAREISHRGKPHVHCPCAKCNVVFIGLSPARSDIPIIYHKNQLGVVLVNDWFISQ